MRCVSLLDVSNKTRHHTRCVGVDVTPEVLSEDPSLTLTFTLTTVPFDSLSSQDPVWSIAIPSGVLHNYLFTYLIPHPHLTSHLSPLVSPSHLHSHLSPPVPPPTSTTQPPN